MGGFGHCDQHTPQGMKYRAMPALEMPQDEVRQFCPPTTHIWRGNCRREWWGHCLPYARVRESVQEHGNEEVDAIKAVVKTLWTQYLTREALDVYRCPVAGLFPVPV